MTNIEELLKRVKLTPEEKVRAWKAACGDNTDLVELSYPDVLLEAQVNKVLNDKDVTTLSLIAKRVKEIENPYSVDVHLDAGVYDGLKRKAVEGFRQAVLNLLEAE